MVSLWAASLCELPWLQGVQTCLCYRSKISFHFTFSFLPLYALHMNITNQSTVWGPVLRQRWRCQLAAVFHLDDWQCHLAGKHLQFNVHACRQRHRQSELWEWKKKKKWRKWLKTFNFSFSQLHIFHVTIHIFWRVKLGHLLYDQL